MRGERFLCGGIISGFFGSGIAHNLAALQQLFNLLEVILTDDMRGDDQFPITMFVKILDEDLLIRRPRRPCDEHLWLICVIYCLLTSDSCLLYKRLHNRQLLRRLLDLEHTVETGIANDRHVMNTDLA